MKTKWKRLSALLLTAALTLSAGVPAASAADHWWEQYVSAPMQDWSIDGVSDGHVTSSGRYVLVTSDTHRYTYLAKELLAQANLTIQQDSGTGNVGLMCFGGDFANEYVLYDDNMSIVKAALESSPGTVATYTKGNHEGSVTDEEFLQKTGMSRIGETAVNKDGLYHFFNFGALNKTQQFTDDDIAQLKAYLEKTEVSGDGKPIIIVSHYPLHYYNDRRSSKNADQVLALLNQYPQVIFLWGHNHTEQDPNYGMIRVPGDIIQTGAAADTSKEIKFTYACLGALRDGINEANGLLMRINDDGSTTFRYIGLHASASSTDSWTDAQGNVNPVRETSNVKVSSDNTYATPTEESYKTISLANVQLQRPLVDKTPADTLSVYSPRFTAGTVSWSANGTAVSGIFDFSTVYTASFTLTAADGYTFAPDAVISINKEYVGPAPGQSNHAADSVSVSADGKTATVSYTFPATTAKGDPAEAVDSIVEGENYVLAAADQNIAASYLYDPAQHGEESMPDYSASPADVVIREGKLVSASTASIVFTAQKDDSGYLLWSDASIKDNNGATTLNFLTMSTRGGDLGLEAAETAGMEIYNNWNLENGVPYLNVDGAKCYAAYQNGAFCFVTTASESNLRLYKVGVNSDTIIYNVNASLEAPVPGAAPAVSAEVSPSCTVTQVQWDAEAFGYDTAYTVTLTLTPKEGYTVSDSLTGRVNGAAGSIRSENGTLILSYTFPATTSAPGRQIGLQGKGADTLAADTRYIIAAEDTALTTAAADGIYLGGKAITVSNDSITSKLTTDMVFTAVGNDEDGYALKNGSKYLAGRAVDDSPDKWGFTLTDDLASAITFGYEDGKLVVVSTGASAGPGGPPSTVSSYLYLNDGHFNFGTLQSSGIALYALELPFTDVAKDWSYDYIYTAAADGLMIGTETTEFSPGDAMTRAMAITVLYRLDGEPSVSGTAGFTDVKDDYYTNALVWGSQNKIVYGIGDGLYDPDAAVTRQEFATMIERYMKYRGVDVEDNPAVSFTDANEIQSYAKNAVTFCAKAEIIQGYPDKTFRPAADISREEVAAMLVRMMDYLG